VPPGGDQLALPGLNRGGVQPLDSPDDQGWVLADYTKFSTPARFAYWASLGPTTGVITLTI